jgi:hypothetical protein
MHRDGNYSSPARAAARSQNYPAAKRGPLPAWQLHGGGWHGPPHLCAPGFSGASDKDTVVLLSGVVEIGLGLALLFLKGKNRVRMGLGLAAFYVAIFPGNIHQYTEHISAFNLDTDGKRLARLFGQPVLIGVALWSTGALKALYKK